MKEKLIMFAIGAAWAAGCAVATFVLSLNNQIIVMRSDVTFQQKQIDGCVPDNVYQVDKQLMIERMRR